MLYRLGWEAGISVAFETWSLASELPERFSCAVSGRRRKAGPRCYRGAEKREFDAGDGTARRQ